MTSISSISAQELYNELMKNIEPDLTTDQLPLLDQKYVDETPEDRQFRMNKYELAYIVFDDALEQSGLLQQEQVVDWKAALKEQIAMQNIPTRTIQTPDQL